MRKNREKKLQSKYEERKESARQRKQNMLEQIKWVIHLINHQEREIKKAA